MAAKRQALDLKLADEDYCYVTTVGRISGKPHTVEIWFGVSGATIYVLAGSRHDADFVRNAKKQPQVRVRIANEHFNALARIAISEAEDALARKLLLEKYAPPRYAGDLEEWGRDALPVAFDLSAID